MIALSPTRFPPPIWAVVLLAVSAATRAEAQTSDDEAPSSGPDDPVEVQPSSEESAPEEPGPDDEDDGSIRSKIASPNDVLQQLRTGAAERYGLFEHGLISLVYPPWRDLNNKLDEKIGLRLGFTYYVLMQYTTPGADPRGAASGDLDFFGRWALLKGEGGVLGKLGFNLEHRHAYTSIPPSRLNVGMGSIWRTTRGFTDTGFNFNELWWHQQLANNRISFRVGTINQKHFYDLHRFKSQKQFFLSTPLSDSPTIAFPRNGLGAVVRVSPLEELHIVAGIGDANGTRSVGGFDTFFGDAEFFTALDLSFTPTFDGFGDGRYSVTLWHTDASSSRGRPSGRGISAVIEQEIIENVVPFARYGYGDGADLLVEHLVAIGVGIEDPFGQEDDVAGVGANWARPPGVNPRDQWGFEAFYRVQLTPVVQVTPGVQLIINPALNPATDVIAVFELRFGFIF